MRALATAIVAVVLAGCTGEPPPASEGLVGPTASSPSTATPQTREAPAAGVPRRPYDVRIAVRTVRHLAGDVGPRHATSQAYRRAASWVAHELAGAGYVVRRQWFRVPAGLSWGVPVRAGWSSNVVATPRGLSPTDRHLIVGAHLDTVPQAPGAEDNASGVGVLLALARTDLAARLPVVLVAFGAEEPRGPGDGDHHYGSRHYVESLGARQRRALRGMLALDRVGVGSVVPVGSAGQADPVQQQVLRAARQASIPVDAQGGQRSSDHWSFVRAGLPGARLGSTPYAEYHSAADLPPVVSRAQLLRAGRLVIAWIRLARR